MAKEWTDDEVQEAIRDAVKIVAADKERAEYERLHGLYGQKQEENEDQGDGKTPPPKKDKEDKTPPKGKRSLWWGEPSGDDE